MTGYSSDPKVRKVQEAREIIDGAEKVIKAYSHVRVNDKCPCRSGKKYKKCCIFKVNGMKSFLKQPDIQQFKQTFDEKTEDSQ